MIRLRVRVALVAAAVAASMHGASAQLAPRSTAEWIKVLDSPDRVASLHVDDIVAKLRLQRGANIADIGAGTGIFSIAMAREVAPGGKVYAVEVDQGLVDYIRTRASSSHVTNVQPILGRFTDPALPASDVDLAFFHDALHHIADRPGYLERLSTYLKPSARIAVVEMDPVKGSHSNDPSLQITKAQLAAWMAALGFESEQQSDLSPEKWFAVYARKR